MKNPEKITEPFVQTVIRTVITTTIIAGMIFFLHLFPSFVGKSKLALFEMIWSAIFCIVFGGHWLELLFINYLKFALPRNILIWYFVRMVYWCVCSFPLFFMANLVFHVFGHNAMRPGHWYTFGLLYIAIELFMHAIMQVKFKKSFYNGVY